MRTFQTILHPTDFSDEADFAFGLASTIARESGARLVVLHVSGSHVDIPRPIETELGIAFDTSGDYATYDAELKARLHDQFETTSDIRVETRLLYGPTPELILQMAGEIGCDLIVMGTHGRAGLSRLLLGSVTESVLSRAQCAVMTVKAPAKLQSEESETRETTTVTA